MQATEIKQRARELMLEKRKPVMLCSFIYLAAYMILYFLIYKLYGYDKYLTEFYSALTLGDMSRIPEFPQPEPAALALIAAVGIMLVILGTGYTGSVLKTVRGEEYGWKALLDGFEFFLKAVVLHFLRAAAIWLGFVLFIIPGVLLLYRYRLAVFVMFDNPDKGAVWCMRESGRLMRGRKMELFRLDLSFFPFYLLSQIVAFFAAPVVELWLRPYFGVSCAEFYQRLLPAEGETPGKAGESGDAPGT